MITLPSIRSASGVRLYRDSNDPELIYFDALVPLPAHGDLAVRWLPLPGSAYLVGEVQFAPAEGRLAGGLADPTGHTRTLPVPWEPAVVYAWYRQGKTTLMAAQGRTSGYGTANAVLNGIAPAGAIRAEAKISAELCCRAKLAAGRLRGGGSAETILAALPRLPIAERAGWGLTLGKVLVEFFSNLLMSGELSLEIYQIEARSELRELALLEWAHRLVTAQPVEMTLAYPAGQVSELRCPGNFDLNLSWDSGDLLPLRAVRTLRHSPG